MTMKSATFTGVFLKKPVIVTFAREENGDWLLTMFVDNETLPTVTIPKRQQVRACWATACDYLRAATDGPKTSRKEVKIPGAAAPGHKPRIAKGTA